jgi:catechol 2,3-dioxygenase-like lactoylglutathione lyase family enzyme
MGMGSGPTPERMPQARVARIGHVGVVVRDMDATLAFYCEVLGLRLTERFEYPEEAVGHGTSVRAGGFVRCDATHHCISFFTLRQGSDDDHGLQLLGLHHLAFEMRTPAELLAMYHRIKGLGHEIVNARSGGPGNQPRFYARDPDGNLLEFYWAIDEIGWDGTPRPYAPIVEIELERFDFAAYEAARGRAATEARSTAGRTGEIPGP